MTNNYRRWAPGVVSFVVGGLVVFAAPYVYPANRSDPMDMVGHLLAGLAFGVFLAIVYDVTRRVVERT